MAAALIMMCAGLFGGLWTWAADLDEFKVKRQDVYEFTEKPAVTRAGDNITITFTSKAYCDATVAIEDADGPSTGSGHGKIIRHLACGVLGSNAPAPFQKNSLKQTVIWDGKNDKGEYIENKDAVVLRVSLGLRPQFERTLFWSPYKRERDPKAMLGVRQLAAAAPEGVYVYEGMNVRLYNHDGEYLRTIYPFPARTMGKIKGLTWTVVPPGDEKFPQKIGRTFGTFLSSEMPALAGMWTIGDSQLNLADTATAMAVHGNRVFLVGHRLNRLPTEGPIGDFELEGPRTSFDSGCIRHDPPVLPIITEPLSAAASPDGKWLYMTNYPASLTKAGNYGGYRCLQAVTRMAVDGTEPPQPFMGVMKADAAGAGNDNQHFDVPRCVTTDREGRLYVADYLNQRVQVFDPDGKFLKSIPCQYPTEVRVSPKTGEIYVFSWGEWVYRPPGAKGFRPEAPPVLIRFGPLADPQKLATFSLSDFVDDRRAHEILFMPAAAEVDFATTPPTIWLTRKAVVSWRAPRIDTMSILLLAEQGRKLVVKRDFAREAEKQVARIRPPRHLRQRLYFNPGDGCVYVGEHFDPAPIHMKSFNELVRISPDSGRISLVRIPCTAEDMAFGQDGLAYLRAGFGDREPMGAVLARFDPRTWREVPFDYGEHHERVSYQGYGETTAASVIVSASRANESSQFGGIAVSPRGHVAAAFYNPNHPQDRRDPEGKLIEAELKPYELRLYPGRASECFIHVWDEHGKLLYEDAVPGVGRTVSIGIDRDDNLYLLATGTRRYGAAEHPVAGSCTLVKVKPQKARFLSSGGSPRVPLAMAPEAGPKRAPDIVSTFGSSWLEGAEWMYGGVGLDGKGIGRCHCENTSQMALDCYGRAFAPETQRYDIVVIDGSGNTILRTGRYGNVEDGVPLVKGGGPPAPVSLGGDEVALFRPNYVATDTDRRLFIADVGNARIVSVKLGYYVEEKVALKDVKDQAGR